LELNASKASANPAPFEFDRKFLFKVLCLGNAQLAQVCKAKGPNTQSNAACAGTTQAVAMGLELLRNKKCERVVVVAGDNATSQSLLPWLGNGFRALGAASTCADVCNAALPFDKRRNGMILGAGAVGIVFETASSLRKRSASSESIPPTVVQPKCRLIDAQFSNSAYHGAALDRKHIASELDRFLNDVEAKHGITKSMIAKSGVFLSHETCTHASPSSSCAANEVGALRDTFGDELLAQLTLVNTKGFTGHAMGVSFEDVTAVELLSRQMVPPMPNNSIADPYLGNIKLSVGGSCEVKYALRFSAGFGSHVCFALYASLGR
jgi:3-oxoacyl-(acyl-carrier-protein) synthase